MADEIGQEQDRAIQDRDHHEFASFKISFDLGGQRGDPTGDLNLRDENLPNLFPPLNGDAPAGGRSIRSSTSKTPGSRWWTSFIS